MAIDSDEKAKSPRRTIIGGNVLLAILLVIGIVGVLQAIAFSVPGAQYDMTSSQVNSLGDATKHLLGSLKQPVTLTSLYFKTDLEEKDQPLYRRAVRDLLTLYESTARSKVTADFINPLSDHEQLNTFEARLRDKPRFKKALDAYRERIDAYTKTMDEKMRALVNNELEALKGLTSGPVASPEAKSVLGQVQTLFQDWLQQDQQVRDQIDALTGLENVQYSAATSVLETHYRDFIKSLQNIASFGTAQLARNPDLAKDKQAADFLRNAGQRYADLVGELEGESTKLGALEPLKYDELLKKLAPNANAIVVETPDDARVVEFSDIWPPIDPRMGGARAHFKDRAFKGEEKITSAILRVTHREQTAVVFVRYGGAPLLVGGFMPGQPQAPYARMKKQLEDANFVVKEWDLKEKNEPPTIDPKPTRTLYVVLQPTPPQQGPMGQPSQDPPFTDANRQAFLKALGDNGRAVFIAGWYPGPFGAIPANYEYDDYLKSTWGIDVDTKHLLIETINYEPGKYAPPRNTMQLFTMTDLTLGDHPIVSGAQAQLLALPFAAPLVPSDKLPDGVKQDTLVTVPDRDTVWGVTNLQTYQQQLTEQGYMTRAKGDTLGPFVLAMAATKGDAKIVVVSSRNFATDDVAFAQALAMTSKGLTIRSRNPGNVTLLINSLYWLDDNMDFMNIGEPINASVLAIKGDSTVKEVRALTIFVWPVLALLFGGVALWIRRR